MSWESTVWQVAAVSSPAVRGLLYAAVHGGVFALSAVASLTSGALVLSLRPAAQTAPTARPGWDDLVAGLRYVARNRLVLGTISLDLFAVLFGGAVALLPVFASDVLHVGAWGLGLLRSAPAVGAAAMAAWLAYHPIERRAGWKMLAGVGVFGAATGVFSLSRSFGLSLAALAVSGAADMVSVVVRQHTVQLATPDAMRGRVSAVNMVFVSTSNELGEFESGVTAEWLGPRRAGALGGALTLAVVAAWSLGFASLRRLDRLDTMLKRDG
ncbi:MAG: MFS transporter [Polyangiales bacterium]